MVTSPFPAARIKHENGLCLLYPNRTVRIGRSSECELVVNDPKVSRVHAEVAWEGDGFTIRDLGSANGTFVNGQPVEDNPRRLEHGDRIMVYQHGMAFEMLSSTAGEPSGELPFEAGAMVYSRKSPRLVVRSGPDEGQEFALWGDQVTIGRSSQEATWEIRLSDRSVSRPHAALRREGETFTLTDLNSANGTLLNGVILEETAVLKNGDEVRLGETQLVFYA